MTRRQFAIGYLYLQGGLCLVWWGLMLAVPQVRDLFVVDGWPRYTLFAFWLADLVLWTIGSWAAAHGLRTGASWTSVALGCAFGGVSYPTLYCVGAGFLTGSGWLGAVLMAPAVVVTGLLVKGMARGGRL